MKRVLNQLLWIEELLPSEVVPRNMHGGTGYYLDEKLMVILTESSLSYQHKGRSFPFQVWNGCIIPVEKIKQSAVWVRFQFLENHPANKDWLYLPADTEDFEEKIKLIIREIKKRNPLFGLPLKMKAPAEEEAKSGPSRPKMFEHGPVNKVKKENKTVSKMKTASKPKADKKRENNFFLSVLKGKK